MKRDEIFEELLHAIFAFGTITIALGILRKLMLPAPSHSGERRKALQHPRSKR